MARWQPSRISAFAILPCKAVFCTWIPAHRPAIANALQLGAALGAASACFRWHANTHMRTWQFCHWKPALGGCVAEFEACFGCMDRRPGWAIRPIGLGFAVRHRNASCCMRVRGIDIGCGAWSVRTVAMAYREGADTKGRGGHALARQGPWGRDGAHGATGVRRMAAEAIRRASYGRWPRWRMISQCASHERHPGADTAECNQRPGRSGAGIRESHSRMYANPSYRRPYLNPESVTTCCNCGTCRVLLGDHRRCLLDPYAKTAMVTSSSHSERKSRTVKMASIYR